MDSVFSFLPSGNFGRVVVIALSIAAIAAVIAYIRFRILPWVFRGKG